MGLSVLLICGGQAEQAPAQVVVPATPRKFATRGTGGGTLEGSSAVSPPEVRHIVYLSPLRQWTNAEGKKVLGLLMAFAAPEPGQEGPVQVIRDGKIKLFLPGNDREAAYELEKLGAEDQALIRQIARAAEKGAPPARP